MWIEISSPTSTRLIYKTFNWKNKMKEKKQTRLELPQKIENEYSREGATAAGIENKAFEANGLIKGGKERNFSYLHLNGVYLWAASALYGGIRKLRPIYPPQIFTTKSLTANRNTSRDFIKPHCGFR